jgi:RimJ/RimL family protein N-acetyltransferase
MVGATYSQGHLDEGRPWQSADMPGLLAAMRHDYPSQGLAPHPDVDANPGSWTGPRDDHEAAIWLCGQDHGWRIGDWLTLAVLDQQGRVLGQVGLTNRAGGRIGNGGFGGIHYWAAAEARGRGIAPSAVRAMTDRASGRFGSDGLPLIMLVHYLTPAGSRANHRSGVRRHLAGWDVNHSRGWCVIHVRLGESGTPSLTLCPARASPPHASPVQASRADAAGSRVFPFALCARV